MSLFSKKAPLMNEIRCDEPSYLIWKWRPAGEPANSRRANAIRWGSSLRVKPNSVAVLVYNQPDGYVYDYIEGPADMLLETSNLPILADVVGRAYGGGSPSQAEVYFINLAELLQIPFGVPFFDVFDPRFVDYSVPTAVRGTIDFKIADYQEFISLHQLQDFDLNALQARIKDAVIKIVKNVVANAPAERNIPVMQLERKLLDINSLIEPGIKSRLYQDFGVTVSAVDISAIELDRTSDGYWQLKAVTQDISMATIRAQSEVNIQNMRDEQRINMEHTQEVLKAQREETQYAQRLQTQTDHFATHQLNQQAAVGVAGANALGQSGAGGLNPAAMMAGLSVGSAIGQNMSGMINGMMVNMGQAPESTVPPPVPSAASQYYIAVEGQPAGPYKMDALREMAADGTLTSDRLVWKTGMRVWVPAGEVQEIRKILPENK